MGTWETSIFGDDVACDVRDHYRQLLEEGIDDGEASRQTATVFNEWFQASDSRTAALVAFAVTQSKLGRLDSAVRDQAVAVIDQGGDLEIWARQNPSELGQRKAALQKARAQLTGPQPNRKPIKPPTLVKCGLVAGDVLALDLPSGLVLIRTVRVRFIERYGESPLLEELDFCGSEVPAPEIIERLPAVINCNQKLSFTPSRYEAMFSNKKAGWKEAGFRKVANIPSRPGDDMARTSQDVFWWAIAREYLKRSDPKTLN